jgi:hypothetical protein
MRKVISGLENIVLGIFLLKKIPQPKLTTIASAIKATPILRE